MIKQPNNWNEVQEITERQKLPLGAYVCNVINAQVQDNGYGEQLCIVFDIAEGEYAGFYKKEFAANTMENKKYKGVLRMFLPKHDGSEQDEWTKRTLKGLVTAFEKSNPGYKWNWNEQSLVGKNIGVLYRNEEWEYEGKTGWTARPFRAISTDSVRSGEFTLPKDKPLKNKSENSFGSIPDFSGNFSVVSGNDAQLPWEF